MMAYLRRATLSSLLTSLCFTALVLGRESCVLWLQELSQVPISLLLPSRRPLSIPTQVLVREVSACPSLTVFSPPPSSYNSSFLPFRKSTESTTPTRNIIHSVTVQFIIFHKMDCIVYFGGKRRHCGAGFTMLVSSQPVRKAASTPSYWKSKNLLVIPGRVGSARGFLKINSPCVVAWQHPAAVGSSETTLRGGPCRNAVPPGPLPTPTLAPPVAQT